MRRKRRRMRYMEAKNDEEEAWEAYQESKQKLRVHQRITRSALRRDRATMWEKTAANVQSAAEEGNAQATFRVAKKLGGFVPKQLPAAKDSKGELAFVKKGCRTSMARALCAVVGGRPSWRLTGDEVWVSRQQRDYDADRLGSHHEDHREVAEGAEHRP